MRTKATVFTDDDILVYPCDNYTTFSQFQDCAEGGSRRHQVSERERIVRVAEDARLLEGYHNPRNWFSFTVDHKGIFKFSEKDPDDYYGARQNQDGTWKMKRRRTFIHNDWKKNLARLKVEI